MQFAVSPIMTSVFTLVLSFGHYCLLLVVFYTHYYLSYLFIIHHRKSLECILLYRDLPPNLLLIQTWRHEDLSMHYADYEWIVLPAWMCPKPQTYGEDCQASAQIPVYRTEENLWMDTQGQVGFSSAGRLHRLMGSPWYVHNRNFSNYKPPWCAELLFFHLDWLNWL